MEGYGGGSDDMILRERVSEGLGGVQSVSFFYMWSRSSCQSTVLHCMIVWVHTRTRIIKEHVVIRHCCTSGK